MRLKRKTWQGSECFRASSAWRNPTPQESLRSLPPGVFYGILDLKSVPPGFLTQVSVGVPLLKRNNLLAPPALWPLLLESRLVCAVRVDPSLLAGLPLLVDPLDLLNFARKVVDARSGIQLVPDSRNLKLLMSFLM